MTIRDPFLAIIGHGTTGRDKTGKEDIEKGIHLRWQFRRDMGFPLGCFRLFWRPNKEYGTPICLDFTKIEESEVHKPFKAGPKKKAMIISSSHWPLALEASPAEFEPRRAEFERFLVIPEAELKVTLPECV